MPEHERLTFIIRMWREPREIPHALPEWRGLVEQVGSDEQKYFQRLEELVDFIRKATTSFPGGSS